MPSLSFAVRARSLEVFLSVYEPQQAVSWVSSTGSTLLHLALGNTDPAARVGIAHRLLDDGADAAAVTPSEDVNGLHILFGQTKHDVAAEAGVVRRLLDGGADVNHVSPRWGTPLQTLATTLQLRDEDLGPIYDILFDRPDLDLLRPGESGLSTLESSRLLADSRADLTRRMEDYLRRTGHDVPPR